MSSPQRWTVDFALAWDDRAASTQFVKLSFNVEADDPQTAIAAAGIAYADATPAPRSRVLRVFCEPMELQRGPTYFDDLELR